MTIQESAAAGGAQGVRAAPSNRRAAVFYSIVALLAIVGIADSLYLTVEHLAGRSVICTFSAGCSKVLASPYARVGSLPLAGVGVAAYFVVFGLAVFASFGYRGAKVLLLPLTVGMFAMTVWLLVVQAFLLHSFCDYCLLSAAITSALTAMVTVKAARESKARRSR